MRIYFFTVILPVQFGFQPLRLYELTLPNEDDGVQVILSVLITDSTENSLMQKILITMWYIWKAQNDQRFGRKTWNTWQVHHAVTAYINTANSANSTADEQDYATQEALHNPEAVTSSSIDASSAGINNQMTGITPLHADHCTGSSIRMSTDEQGQNTTDAAPSGMTSFIAGHNITVTNPVYRIRENLVGRFTVQIPRTTARC